MKFIALLLSVLYEINQFAGYNMSDNLTVAVENVAEVWDFYDTSDIGQHVLPEQNNKTDEISRTYKYGTKQNNYARSSYDITTTLIPDFIGYGSGEDGVRPPSSAELDGVRPEFCYLIPVRGMGPHRSWIYAYYSSADKCDLFMYSGVGGNLNKFLTKKTCEETCRRPKKSTCLGMASKFIDE